MLKHALVELCKRPLQHTAPASEMHFETPKSVRFDGQNSRQNHSKNGVLYRRSLIVKQFEKASERQRTIQLSCLSGSANGCIICYGNARLHRPYLACLLD